MKSTKPIDWEIVEPDRPGRRSKLNPQVAERAAELIEMGLTYTQTADALGVGRTTFHRWRKENETFRDTLKKAEAQGVAAMLGVIRAASAKSWQAAAWLLERRHPAQWAKTENLSVEARRRDAAAEIGEKDIVKQPGLSPEAAEGIIRALSGETHPTERNPAADEQ